MNEKDQNSKNTPDKKRNPIASIIVALVGFGSAAYLFLPIPDITDALQFVPLLSNIDEAGATALLISCLAYFGLDIGAFFGRARKKEEPKSTKGEVINK